MHIATIVIKIGLVLCGALFLTISLKPIRQLISHLPNGSLKNKWNVLSGFIIAFIIGYLFYAIDFWLQYEQKDDSSLVVPTIFFLGAIFVLMVGGLALQTAKDIKRISILQHQSVTDSLMSINNRRYFEQSIDEKVRMANRYGLELSLILLDIDKFKSVNDNYGHLSGDEVLRNLAKVIKGIVRDSDIICRYGGEEIAIICPQTTLEDTLILAERLRKIIEHSILALSCGTQEEIKATISAGVSSLKLLEVKNKEYLIKKADFALYEAKQAGRNKVIALH
jgi:diguanylate cyclase (GGDEF)-like protein